MKKMSNKLTQKTWTCSDSETRSSDRRRDVKANRVQSERWRRGGTSQIGNDTKPAVDVETFIKALKAEPGRADPHAHPLTPG